MCRPVKKARSAPIVAIHCGLRRRANVCGAAARRKRGSSHMLMASDRVGDAQRGNRHARTQAEGARHGQRGGKRSAERGACGDEGAIDALEGRRRDAGRRAAPRPGISASARHDAAKRESSISACVSPVGAEAAEPGLLERRSARAAWVQTARHRRARKDAHECRCRLRRSRGVTVRRDEARRRAHVASGCVFSNAARCASPQKTPPRPGSASSRGRCTPHCGAGEHRLRRCRRARTAAGARAAARSAAQQPEQHEDGDQEDDDLHVAGGARCSSTSSTKREPT